MFRVTCTNEERKRAYVSNFEGTEFSLYPTNAYYFKTWQKAGAITRKIYTKGPHVQKFLSVNSWGKA